MKALADCTRSHPQSFSDSGIFATSQYVGDLHFFRDTSRLCLGHRGFTLLVHWVLFAGILVPRQVLSRRPLLLMAMLANKPRSFTVRVLLADLLVPRQVRFPCPLRLMAMLANKPTGSFTV